MKSFLRTCLAGTARLAEHIVRAVPDRRPGMCAGLPPNEDDTIRRRRRLAEQSEDESHTNKRVLSAISAVPRHLFVPEEEAPHAYRNQALAIGCGQTISQPYIAALMTELLDPKPGMRILEIGTGSGYQAALLAFAGAAVFTVEIVPELARSADKRLRTIGIAGVEVREGDGYEGWPESAPFDGILVACAVPRIPQPLLDQLKEGGRMEMPLGEWPTYQELTVVDKLPGGKHAARAVTGVVFVPLTGPHGLARGEGGPPA